MICKSIEIVLQPLIPAKTGFCCCHTRSATTTTTIDEPQFVGSIRSAPIRIGTSIFLSKHLFLNNIVKDMAVSQNGKGDSRRWQTSSLSLGVSGLTGFSPAGWLSLKSRAGRSTFIWYLFFVHQIYHCYFNFTCLKSLCRIRCIGTIINCCGF